MPRSPRHSEHNNSTVSALSSLIESLPRLVGDRVHLLVLEMQRAGQAVGWLAAMAIAALLMVVTAWFGVWGGVVLALRHYDMSWPWVVTIVVVLNLAGAAVAGLRALSLVKLLGMPATLRRLTFASPPVVPRPLPVSPERNVVPASAGLGAKL